MLQGLSDHQVSGRAPSTGTLTWAAGGLLPGLTLNAGTGRITGVPGGPGTYSVRLGASDAHGDTAYRTFHWTVTPDLRQVPEIFDLTRPQANAALVSIGLRLGAETVEFGRMGRVLSQSLDPGTMVPSGTRVNYTIGGRPSDGRQCNWLALSLPGGGEAVPRERDVLGLMAERLSNVGIGRRLHFAPKTVEAHVAHIFTTLGLHTDDDSNRRVRALVTLLRSTAMQPAPVSRHPRAGCVWHHFWCELLSAAGA
jgi:DNA-binding CsgD family transcriptional regulator